MTEDDTFRKLKQLPFESVRLKIVDLAYNGPKLPSSGWKICVFEVLSDSGWTEEEYQKEFIKQRT